LKLYIVVEVFQLVVSGTYATPNLLDAKAKFKEYTGVDHDILEKYLKEDEDAKPEELLGDYDQTKIFEFELGGLHIEEEDIIERLKTGLERELSEEELAKFKGYLAIDVPQWLADNTKSFVRQLREEEQMYHDIPDEGEPET